MTQLTLGERLAQNIAEERANTRAAQERAAGHASEKARKEYDDVAKFFEEAKATIEEHILAGRQTKDLLIQVGRSGRGAEVVNAHDPIYTILAGWNSSGGLPVSLQGRGKFSALWADFLAWGASQGLVPRFEHAHDGVGMYSWWEIRVAPASAVASVPRSESPKQRRERVLSQTLEAYMDAATALLAMRPHPRALAHLEKFGPALAEARSLFADQAKA